MQLSHHLVVGALFFIGAVWVYKCGPSVKVFYRPLINSHPVTPGYFTFLLSEV